MGGPAEIVLLHPDVIPLLSYQANPKSKIKNMLKYPSMQFDKITSLVFDFDGTLATCPYDFGYMRQCILATAEEFGVLRVQLDGFGLLESIE
jgi:hypothetical protein